MATVISINKLYNPQTEFLMMVPLTVSFSLLCTIITHCTSRNYSLHTMPHLLLMLFRALHMENQVDELQNLNM